MASWMIHFRVAQALLDRGVLGNAPDAETIAAFIIGNIAPDSGVPTPDGTGYIPSKTTSHFMRLSEDGFERPDPAVFIAEWLSPALNPTEKDKAVDPVAVAFYRGYLAHLATDNAWVRDIIFPAKVRFAPLRLEGGVETPAAVALFYAFLKKEWYDMDFLYLKHHPDFPTYRAFVAAPPFENRYLPFFPTDAFEARRAGIVAFYRQGVETVEERETYLSEAELDRFVDGVSREIGSEFEAFFSETVRLCEPTGV